MASKWVWVMFLCMFVFIENCWSEGCWKEERFALLQLKRSIDYPSSLASWVERDENLDCCQWERVWCNETTGRVIQLNLIGIRFGMPGEWYLNASLFSPFQELELLYLSYNNITGWVENQELNFLSNLEKLDLSNNAIDNFVISKGLSNLEILDLSGNFLKRSFLSNLTGLLSLRSLYLREIGLKETFDIQELDFLSNLEELDISFNAIDNFVVPKDYRSLRKLNSLDLSGVKITDGSTLLQSMGSFPSLRWLYLEENNFTRTVINPTELHNFTNLERLDLDFSSFHISLLQSIAAFNSLKSLLMSFCNLDGISNFQGSLTFANLENLQMDGIDLDINFFQIITQITSLKILSLYDCGLAGMLSDQGLGRLSRLSNLTFLNLGSNSLNNSILSYLDGLSLLRKLYLNQNELKGSIEIKGLCGLVNLQALYIGYNDLRGTLPRCLANMTSLQYLDISSNQLTGDISSSPLTFLTSIKDLTLSNNHFQIPISLEPFYNHSKLTSFYGENNHVYAEIGSHFKLPKFQLRYLRLSGYGSGGTFPKFLYHQHELEEVDLSHMNLSGQFPSWLLENNTKLSTLLLVNNSLSRSFQLPIRPHTQLTTIDASSNFFEGQIPNDIGAYLPSLMSVNISKNALNGSIPSSFGNMSLLRILDISHNQLIGEIPESIGMGCFSLRILALSNNSLQGHIFSKNVKLTNLLRLQLDDNNFTGKIPESLSNCSLLRGLSFSNNHLSGGILGWLGTLPNLEDIIMPNNHLEGPIPTEFCQLHFLKVLDLSNNSIFGSLPSCFSPFSIKQVHLSRNKIEGQIKDVLLYSPSMVTLDLSYNRLNGSIPNSIDRLSQLTYLILANNNLEGEIPIQLCQLNKLRLVDLSHNNLFGQIPACLDNTALHESYQNVTAPTPYASSFAAGNMSLNELSMRREETIPFTTETNELSVGRKETIPFTTKKMSYYYQGRPLNDMYGMDFSCNKLTGEIPPQIGYLTRIRALNLSHNNLTRSIPLTFSYLKQIESLDLSYNKLNGKIPPQLVELNALVVFSIAYNNLSGKIPEWIAQFATFNESSYEGNALLCGPPLKSCNDISSMPKASTSYVEDNNLIDMNSFYITFIVSYVILLLGFFIVLYVNPYWRRKWFYLVETWMISSSYFVVDHLPRRFFH